MPGSVAVSCSLWKLKLVYIFGNMNGNVLTELSICSCCGEIRAKKSYPLLSLTGVECTISFPPGKDPVHTDRKRLMSQWSTRNVFGSCTNYCFEMQCAFLVLSCPGLTCILLFSRYHEQEKTRREFLFFSFVLTVFGASITSSPLKQTVWTTCAVWWYTVIRLILE